MVWWLGGQSIGCGSPLPSLANSQRTEGIGERGGGHVPMSMSPFRREITLGKQRLWFCCPLCQNALGARLAGSGGVAANTSDRGGTTGDRARGGSIDPAG